MRYAEARPLIRSGDLLAWCGAKGGVSRLIRCVTGGSWSHVGIAWVLPTRVMVLEAREGRGVQVQALSACLPCDWVATGVAWTPEVEAAALDRLGLPYSYADALRVGLGRAVVHDGAICSTFAGSILTRAGLEVPASGLSPSALVEEVRCRAGAGSLTRIAAD